MRYDGYNGSIEVSETSLTVLREGRLARLSFGKAPARVIPLAAIAGARLQPATRMTNGFVQIVLVGEEAPELGMTTAASYSNAVLFTHKGNEAFAVLQGWLQHVADRNRAEGWQPPPEWQPAPDLAEAAPKTGAWTKLRESANRAIEEEERRKQAKRDAERADGVQFKLKATLKTLIFYKDRIELDEPHGTKKEKTSIPYFQIDSVEINGKRVRPSALLLPEIWLTPKKKILTIRTGRAKYDFDFRRASDDEVKRGYDLIQKGIAASRQQHITVTSAPASAAPTTADEIRSLAKLVEEGLLTQDEFDAKKRQILGL